MKEFPAKKAEQWLKKVYEKAGIKWDSKQDEFIKTIRNENPCK